MTVLWIITWRKRATACEEVAPIRFPTEGGRRTNESRACSKVACSLINTNSFSILPPNEFSIKKKKREKEKAKRELGPTLPFFHNPIPQTTPDVAIMDSLFHGLWLVFSWSQVNISVCRLLAPHSPLCSIDLFAHSSARTTSVPGKPSITEFNTVQIAHFLPNFFIFPEADVGSTGFQKEAEGGFVYPGLSWTAGNQTGHFLLAHVRCFKSLVHATERDNGATSSSCRSDGKTSTSPAPYPSCVLHPGSYSGLESRPKGLEQLLPSATGDGL